MLEASLLIERALKALVDATGIGGELLSTGRSQGAERLALHWDTGSAVLEVTARPMLSLEHLLLLEEGMQRSGLLVTQHVAAHTATALRERGINFIDSAGNAFLNLDGCYVFVSGRSAKRRGRKTASLSTAVWQVAYVLLRDPAAIALSVRVLGRRAGVAHGTVSNSLRALADRAWVTNLGKGRWVLGDLPGLLQAFEFGYVDRLANKHFLSKAVPVGESLETWSGRVRERFEGQGLLLGGGLAASELGLDLVDSSATLHVKAWDAQTMRALRLAPSQTGPLVIRRTFGSDNHWAGESGFTDPLLIRAELSLLQDERVQRAREQLLATVMGRWA
ncbi:MAG: hypothetical protein ACI9VR_005293 [Cognaticolwellia sp.]|jgi:hypothetical protein